MNETPKRANFQQVKNSFGFLDVLKMSAFERLRFIRFRYTFIFLAFECSILTTLSFILLPEELFSRFCYLAESPFFPVNQSIGKQNLLFAAISVFIQRLFLNVRFAYFYTS